MKVRKADLNDSGKIAALALLLWPSHTLKELEDEMKPLLCSEKAAVYLAEENGLPIGFAQCQLRHDYVEGTSSSPVGYLEGIFVTEAHRGKGISKTLLNHCETWAFSKGCLEFASDCELINQNSLAFHLNSGFQEANRIICFVKNLTKTVEP